MTAHAKLSPSSAHRWLYCTPSAALNALEPDTTSDYAEEGTAAHTLAERKLALALGKIKKAAYTKWFKGWVEATPYYNKGFEEAVDKYVADIMELVAEYGTCFVDLEQRVDFSEYVPDGHGTADVTIIASDTLHVVDLKFGQGVPVVANENEQLMLYALGAALKYSLAYDFEWVAMTINQPRIDNFSTHIIPLSLLMQWAEDFVKPQAALAHEGKGEFSPDEKTCRWCKVRAKCKARADKQMELAGEAFADEPPSVLTPDEIAQVLTRGGEFVKWIKEVEDYALSQARDHEVQFPGFKLVEGRSVRVLDTSGATIALAGAGYEQSDYTKPPVLVGITELEKLLGKAEFEHVLGGYITKPPGKPTLVPESDNRPAISSATAAAAAFADD
jgi:hypothetical protein